MSYFKINNSVKRVLVLLISMAMLLNYNMYVPALAAPINPAVETPAPTEASAFTVESGILTGYLATTAQDTSIVVIPAEINKEKITSIEKEVFQYSSELKKVVIPSTVTSIGSYAFGSCHFIEDVYFYGDAGTINVEAFGCDIYDEDNYDEITFHCKPEYLENFKSAIKKFYATIKVEGDVATELKDPAYPEQEEPAGGEKDGSDPAFFSYDIRTLDAGNKVAYINGYKEGGTGGDITLPTEYTDVDGNKYDVKGVAARAFSGSNGSVQGVKDTVALSKITKITVPAEITDIEDFAFNHVGKYSYSNPAYNLKEIEFKGNTADFGKSILSGNPNLGKVVLPSELKIIPNNTFSNCEKLSDINIPESVETIGYASFKECTALHKLRFKNDVPPDMLFDNDPWSKAWPFAGCKALTLEVPNAKINVYKEAWKNMLSETNVKAKGDISLVGWGEEGTIVVSIPDFKIPVGEDESK